MLEAVLASISRYNMLPVQDHAETKLGVAVSGGADSVCLLYVLRGLAAQLHTRLAVVHLNHGTRGEASDDDARFAAELASSLGLTLHLRELDVPALASATGDNLEQAARRARSAFFHELVAQGQVDRVATGHTRNDQAETVLYRMLRGCGLTGLAGILPVTREGLIRPLLEIGRAEIEAWLRERNIAWREDASNQDLSFARNRIRRELLPLLRSGYNPQVDSALASLTEIARDEEAFWPAQIPVPALRPDGTLVLNSRELAGSPPALARRMLRAAIEAVKGDLRQIGHAHLERVLEMARASEGHDRVQLPGVDVLRSFEWIRFAPTGHDNLRERDFSLPIQMPGRASLPDGGELALDVVAAREHERNSRVTVVTDLDWRKVIGLAELSGGECRIRNWRPGDRYCPIGYSHEQKIKTLFQDARVPLWERRTWPVLVCREDILWTRRFGAAEALAATEASTVVLRVRERPAAQNEPAAPWITSESVQGVSFAGLAAGASGVLDEF